MKEYETYLEYSRSEDFISKPNAQILKKMRRKGAERTTELAQKSHRMDLFAWTFSCWMKGQK